jgi:hypothetical protein
MSCHEELLLLDPKVTSIAISGPEDREGDDHRTEIVLNDSFDSMVSSVGSYSATMGDTAARHHLVTTSGLLKWLLRTSNATGGATIPMDSKAQLQSQQEGQQAISAPNGTSHGTPLTSSALSIIGEATAQSALASSGAPPEDFVTLFQHLELMERDLEEERAASQALREENDELVNDNHELVEGQKELESQLEQTNTELGALGQENQEIQKELDLLQGRQLDIAWDSTCSRLVDQKVEDKTTQMQQRVKAALYDKFMLEEHMRYLQQELNQTHTAAETLLKQRNEFEHKAKKLQKHMKKCSCQDPLVFMPDCHSFGPGSFRRRRTSLPEYLVAAAAAEQPCAGNSRARPPAGRMVPRCLSKTMHSISMMSVNKTPRAGQQLNNTISGVSGNRRLIFAASKIQQRPAEIASPAAAASEVVRASHDHDDPACREEENLEPACQMRSWRRSKKQLMDPVLPTSLPALSEDDLVLEKVGSQEEKEEDEKFDKIGPDEQEKEKAESQEEKEEDEKFDNIRTCEQEKNTKKSWRRKEKAMRHYSMQFRRTPVSSLPFGDSHQEDVSEGSKDIASNTVLDFLEQELGTPCGQDATDEVPDPREVLSASSTDLAFDVFPQDATITEEKSQAAPASVGEIVARGVSDIQSPEKKTGYTRWNDGCTSETLDHEVVSDNDGIDSDRDTWLGSLMLVPSRRVLAGRFRRREPRHSARYHRRVVC